MQWISTCVIEMLYLWFTRRWHLFLLSLLGHAAITSSKNTQNWACSICIKHIKWQEIQDSQLTIKAHRLQIRDEVFTFQVFTHIHHKLKSAWCRLARLVTSSLYCWIMPAILGPSLELCGLLSRLRQRSYILHQNRVIIWVESLLSSTWKPPVCGEVCTPSRSC